MWGAVEKKNEGRHVLIVREYNGLIFSDHNKSNNCFIWVSFNRIGNELTPLPYSMVSLGI